MGAYLPSHPSPKQDAMPFYCDESAGTSTPKLVPVAVTVFVEQARHYDGVPMLPPKHTSRACRRRQGNNYPGFFFEPGDGRTRVT